MIKFLDEKIISNHGRSPRAMFFRNGEILIHVARIDQPVAILHSRDHGQSWREENSDGTWPGGYIQLPDGSVMVVMTHNAVWGKFNPKQPYLPFIAQVRKAKSPADLLAGNFTDDFVKVEVPDMACLYGDDGQFGCGVIDHGLVELENGDFLLTMYGVFKNDNIPVPYFTQPSPQNRSWMCRSKDRGRTWHYLSTIASAMDFKLPPLAEGFTEADLIKTDNGGLLSVIRTGGNPAGKGTERFTPIYACTSADHGATWSRPREVYKYGVWPKLAKMSDGTLVCSSGRPGVFFLTSNDNGTSWSSPHFITEYYAEWRKCSSGLTSIGEIEPGKLAIFYDDVIVHDDGRISHPTKMRIYQISR